jgi:hypothetical protein
VNFPVIARFKASSIERIITARRFLILPVKMTRREQSRPEVQALDDINIESASNRLSSGPNVHEVCSQTDLRILMVTTMESSVIANAEIKRIRISRRSGIFPDGKDDRDVIGKHFGALSCPAISHLLHSSSSRDLVLTFDQVIRSNLGCMSDSLRTCRITTSAISFAFSEPKAFHIQLL